MNDKTIILIPARMNSRRLPGKPMLKADGVPLVHWTYLRAKQSDADHVFVISPDKEICQYCAQHGIDWFPTTENPPTGTHRCAEAAERMQEGVGRIINLQVDEPLVEVDDLNRMIRSPFENIITFAAIPECNRIAVHDQNTAKVAVSRNWTAHWFSRAPMRGAMLHCGVYSYPVQTLIELGRLRLTPMSLEESLEQLSWLEAGYKIDVIGIKKLPLSINTQENWDRYSRFVEREQARAEAD